MQQIGAPRWGMQTKDEFGRSDDVALAATVAERSEGAAFAGGNPNMAVSPTVTWDGMFSCYSSGRMGLPVHCKTRNGSRAMCCRNE